MPALSDDDRVKAIEILEQVRVKIDAAAASDTDLRFQIRRYIIKRLEFDERGTPTQRRKLKDLKRKFQRGLCFRCETKLPEQGAELHRLLAIEGYTEANTQLLCRACHQKAQHQASQESMRLSRPGSWSPQIAVTYAEEVDSPGDASDPDALRSPEAPLLECDPVEPSSVHPSSSHPSTPDDDLIGNAGRPGQED